MNEKQPKAALSRKRWTFIAIGSAGLLLTYVFQGYLNIYELLFGNGSLRMPYTGTDYLSEGQQTMYVVNKTFRYLLNDIFSILIIQGIFLKKSYTRFAFVLMAFGLFILLPVYFYIYFLAVPGFSSMISHFHRIVLNPVLMMLLIPALWYQERIQAIRN